MSQVKLERLEVALAEARRLNAELVEALQELLAVTLSMADAVHVTRTDRSAINTAKTVLAKAKQS